MDLEDVKQTVEKWECWGRYTVNVYLLYLEARVCALPAAVSNNITKEKNYLMGSCLQLCRGFEQPGYERQQCPNFTYSPWGSWVFAEIQSTDNVQPHFAESTHNPGELLSEILCLPLEQ